MTHRSFEREGQRLSTMVRSGNGRVTRQNDGAEEVAASGEGKRKVVSAVAWREETGGPEIEMHFGLVR